MYLYAIQTSLFCKIGISEKINDRMAALGREDGIINRKIYNIPNTPTEVCNFIEISIMQKFNSNSEYLKYAKFNEICNYINDLLSNLFYHYYFLNPLQTSLCCINNLYYDLKPAVNYINYLRGLDGKNTFKVNDFAKTKQCQEFNKIICQNKKIQTAIFTKQGSYGSTYGTAEMVFDFITSSHPVAKYEIMNWAINSTIEYKNFINPAFSANKREAVRIALENN